MKFWIRHGYLAALLFANWAAPSLVFAAEADEHRPNVKLSVELYDIDETIGSLIESIGRVEQAIAKLKDVTPEERDKYLGVLEASLVSLTDAVSRLKLSPAEQDKLIQTLEKASSIISDTLSDLQPVLRTLPETIAESRVPVRAYLRDAKSELFEPLLQRTEFTVSALVSKTYLVIALLLLALLLIVLLASIVLYNSIGKASRSVDGAAAAIKEVFEQHKLVPSDAVVGVYESKTESQSHE
jgi:hypothetical protein